MSRAQYELRVSGKLSERARRALSDHDEMRIVAAPPETIIYVTAVDDVPLHGILGLLDNLGLHLVSLDRVPDLPP